jgi:hypothetical protein
MMMTHLTALINQAKASNINAFADVGTLNLCKHDTIDSTVHKENNLVDRSSITSNPDIILQHIVVVRDVFQLRTCSIPATDTGEMSITMGSLSKL